MDRVFSSVAELVGKTPLLELTAIERELNLKARLLAKLEVFNPAGSVKDRIALAMIIDAEEAGRLKPGGTIIEPTSGNTGIGLAAMAASRGYRLIVTMPETMSLERRKLIAAYGAGIVLTPGALGMKGAIDKARELVDQIPGSIIAGQFVNPANPLAHKKTTGPEIWQDTDGNVDIFVAGAGTGGTLTGVGQYLKEKNPQIRIVAVEPAGSPVLTGGKPGPHKIQGIGAGFTPKTLDTHIYDEVMDISDAAAMHAARLMAKSEGFLPGISGGANLAAAIDLAKRPENYAKTIITILPDGGERYLSTELYASGGQA